MQSSSGQSVAVSIHDQQLPEHHDQQQQTHGQQSFPGGDVVVDMVTLQNMAVAQSQLPFTSPAADGNPTEVQMGGMSNDEGASSELSNDGQGKRNGSPDNLSLPRTRPSPPPGEGEGEERDKKRQRRLLQNRQSAALSRQRKKEYLGGLERKNNELDAENKVLKQTVYANDTRLRELEGRLAFFIKQNEELKALLRTSDKVDDMNRLLAQAYSSLALQTAGLSVPGLLSSIGFHAAPEAQHHHMSIGLQALAVSASPQQQSPTTAHGHHQHQEEMDHGGHQLPAEVKEAEGNGGNGSAAQANNEAQEQLSASESPGAAAASISHDDAATVVESLDGHQLQQQPHEEELKQF
jgi:hypothetical protein